jgi:hypothetical protein
MRRGSIISGLMIWVLATSAFGCASGWAARLGPSVPVIAPEELVPEENQEPRQPEGRQAAAP